MEEGRKTEDGRRKGGVGEWEKGRKKDARRRTQDAGRRTQGKPEGESGRVGERKTHDASLNPSPDPFPYFLREGGNLLPIVNFSFNLAHG